METMTISVPENLKNYIEERVRTGGYGNVSEYVRELIRQDQKQNDEARLEMMLLAGLNSGSGRSLTKKDWTDLRQQIRKRIIARRKK